MVTAVSFLRVSIYTVLFLGTHGYPSKGSKSQDEGGSSSHDGHSVSHRGGANGRHAPKSHFSRPVQMVGQAPTSQFVPTGPASGVSSMPQAGYPVSAGFVPVPVTYSAGTVPVQAGYEASSTKSNPPETKWSVNPNIFSEEGLANTEAVSSSHVLPPAPPLPPSGPVLQSGETSNVVKEAELGNYQHETEEFGYPADRMGPGYGFASPLLPSVGGFWGYPGLYPYPYPYPYPSPVFDYRLLYGLYPPGTYTTFNKNHEKGKDYYQSIHYLKEHGSGPSDVPSSHGSGQQKFSPQGAQSS